ncbi:DNRLRE domain-containing protein [Clostridium magnum]|uniref:TGF-beta propeptide n=1 Tax=Clostridium magnum DSM 2767 TaxID=1121326 RepID=A0A162SM49_9CLOT|nr:DNRLRE domain-containing protein [Clostridium magnum]KZL91600.1 hypothetical protein CLMAG_33590 [Clostridium magnum DSM 2767]SHH49087.1 TGF-beta propeptide [Clostridium magnum DSM 2767]
MPCLDIPAIKSLTISNKSPNDNISDIYIGTESSIKYISYLYFDISSIPGNIKDMRATLVLFKKPISHGKDNNYNYNSSNYDNHNMNNTYVGEYIIYPLSEYFSKYTTYSNRPEYVSSLHKSFYTNEKSICEEIDITPIVFNWISGKVPNKGLMFKGGKNTKNLLKFFSVLNKDITEIPFIKIYFKIENHFPLITELNCTCSFFPVIKK